MSDTGRFSNEALRAFTERTGSAIVAVDNAGNITHWNPAATSLFGYNSTQVLGKAYAELLQLSSVGIFRKNFDKIRRGRSVPEFELPHLNQNGQSVEVIVGLYPIAGEDKSGALIISADITARKLAESSMRESAGQIQAIVQTVLDGIITIDHEGIINAFNPAAEKVFQYRAHEVIGCNINILMPEPYHGNHDQYLRNYLHTGEAKVIGIGREVSGKRKDGSVFPMDLAISEMLLANGGKAFVGVVRDISERKTAELALQQQMEETEKGNAELEAAMEQLRDTQQQLVQSEKMASLGQLVAGVAHEINTPVGVGITAASQLENTSRQLRAELAEGTLKRSSLNGFVDTTEESASIILRNLERAAELINSFKRVAVDETSNERRCFLLKGYLDELLSSLSPRIKESGVKVSCKCDAGIQMDSYPGALAQVLTNLIVNALVHAFDDCDEPKLLIRASQENGQVSISITDNGCGVEHKFQDKIFDPFFTTRRTRGGTGLGLHISYNIVTQVLKGAITVNSTPGAGTRFDLRIPGSV